MGPRKVFNITAKVNKKHRIPPSKAVGQFAPGNTADRLITGEYSVSPKRPDQIAYSQKAPAAKERTEVAVADAGPESARVPAQDGTAAEERRSRDDADRTAAGFEPSWRRHSSGRQDCRK